MYSGSLERSASGVEQDAHYAGAGGQRNGEAGQKGNSDLAQPVISDFTSPLPCIPVIMAAMQKDSRLFEDIAKMASGAAGAAVDMRRELEALIGDRIERFVSRGRFVSREEFAVVKAMAEKARSENEALRAEIEKLKC